MISALVMTVSTAPSARRGALPHAVADHLAAAELHLLAVDGAVLLHLEDQVGVGQAHPVADGGAEHLRVGGAVDPVGHALSPSGLLQRAVDQAVEAEHAPAASVGTSVTSRLCPGSKRTAVPAGMSSR